MSNIKKTLEMTCLLFGMVMLFSFIAWFLGYDGFIIIGNISMPTWTTYVIPPILLCVNLSLLTGFVLNLYSWKVLYFSLPLSILSAIGSIFLPVDLFTGPIPTLVLLITIFIKKVGKNGYVRLGIVTVVTIIYQLIISKITNISLFGIVSVYDGFRLSVSSIILMLLFYSIGGAKYEQLVSKRLQFLVFPGFIRDSREDSSKIPKNIDDIPVSKFEVWVMWSVIGVVQILQWIFILWVCNLDNYFIDALVMTTSFICHGMIISKRQHFKPIILCTLIATGMFYICCRFTFSFQYSQFFPIVIGLILVFTLYRISYQIEKANKAKLKKEIERIMAIEDKLQEAVDRFDRINNL